MNAHHARTLPLVVLLLLVGCQSRLIRGDTAPRTVDAIAVNTSSDDGVGWLLAEKSSLITPTASSPVSADPHAAIGHYEALLSYAREPSLRAEAMRRAAYLRIRLVDSGQSADLSLLHEALALYEQLFIEHPQDPANDLAHYQRARALHLLGRTAEAAQSLSTLITEYPASVLYTDAAFRAGELFYGQRRYAEAAAAYAAAAQALPVGDELKEVAQYRVGWAHLQDRQYSASAAAFVTLLERNLPGGITTGDHEAALAQVPPRQRELARNALRGASLAFLGWGGIPDAAQRWEGDAAITAHAPVYYAALGALMRERQRFTDAATIYSAFAERYPRHPEAPAFQARVIATYAEGGFAELEVAARETYIQRYAPAAAYWSDRSPSPNFMADFRAQVLTVAQNHHAVAQQTDALSPARTAAFQHAALRYQQALDLMPEAQDAVDVRMRLADALYEGTRFSDAAAQYHRLAYEHDRHARSEEAALASVQAYQRQVDAIPDGHKTEAQRRVITASLMLAETYTTHPERARVMLVAAETSFDLAQYQEALELAEAVRALPDLASPLRHDATAVVADSQLALADFPAAEASYLALRGGMDRSDARFEAATEQLAVAIYRQGEQARDDARWADAAEAFARIIEVTPTSQRRPAAAFETAVMRVKAEDWAAAAAAFETFRQRHPDHAQVADADKWLTLVYVKADQKGLAAGAFERVAARASEAAEIREEAAWQAADLHRQAGHYRAAKPAYVRYLQRPDASLDRAQAARQQLARLSRELEGDHAESLRWMREILAADQLAGRERTDLSAFLAAKAHLMLGRDSAARAKRIDLKTPINTTLRQRTAAVSEAVDHLSAAIAAGYADIVPEATYEMASVYLDLSIALLASEHPPDLDGAALQEYVLHVEGQAYPMEERALGLHERNLALLAHGHWDQWIKGSAQVLSEMMPARYGKREQREDHYASLQ